MKKDLLLQLTGEELVVFCSTMFGASQTAKGFNKTLYDKLFRKSYALLDIDQKRDFRIAMEALVSTGVFGKMKSFVGDMLRDLE